jgi:DNA replication protein DnaC
MAIQTWDALVESSLRQASTTNGHGKRGCAELRLRPNPEPHYLTNKPRKIAQIPKLAREAIRHLAAGESPWPLVLTGSAGTGKTCAALCMLDHAGGLYFTAAELCETIIRAGKGMVTLRESGRTLCPESLWSELASTRLVVLDEIGARERVSDFAYDVTKRVLDEREGKPLVVISNLGIEALTQIYDDRVSSRLAAGTGVVIEGDDRRLKRGEL